MIVPALTFVLSLVLAACAGAQAPTTVTPPGAAQAPGLPKPLDVPYVPTDEAIVTTMLQMAGVKKGDVVYDLGCGDGRIVITAAKRYGARGVGIDIDPIRIAEAKANAVKAGVADRVVFKEQDLFEADFREASVVTLYLLPDVNLRLKLKLLRDLKPGTRVVSHNYDMGNDWKPEQTANVMVGGVGHTVFFWTIPPGAAGRR
ncbi:MAG: methyltransferase domain-containing protein [Candidatus Rokubacteria bacterium]|nr:methyltransferase domain-containing protein [Candidatus Rokubacteria bacterium]